MVTHPHAAVRYAASYMIIYAHKDASYLSKENRKIRAAVHLYFTKANDEWFNNFSVLTLSSIIKHAMASALEAELAALLYGCKEEVPLRVTLEEMGHW